MTRPSLGLHQLEAREVPAVLVTLYGSEVRITGDGNTDTAAVSIQTCDTATTADDAVRVIHNTASGQGEKLDQRSK